METGPETEELDRGMRLDEDDGALALDDAMELSALDDEDDGAVDDDDNLITIAYKFFTVFPMSFPVGIVIMILVPVAKAVAPGPV